MLRRLQGFREDIAYNQQSFRRVPYLAYLTRVPQLFSASMVLQETPIGCNKYFWKLENPIAVEHHHFPEECCLYTAISTLLGQRHLNSPHYVTTPIWRDRLLQNQLHWSLLTRSRFLERIANENLHMNKEGEMHPLWTPGSTAPRWKILIYSSITIPLIVSVSSSADDSWLRTMDPAWL